MNTSLLLLFLLQAMACLCGCDVILWPAPPTGPPCTGEIRFARGDVDVARGMSTEDDIRNARSRIGYISTVTIYGNCCWRISRRHSHRGQSWTYRSPVSNSTVETRIKSVQKISCES